MAGGGDGERCERIDIGDVMKQLTKLQTTPSKNIGGGTTVGHDLFFEVGDIIAIARSLVQCHKRFFISQAHPVRVVVRCRWHGAKIILISFLLVVEMRKVTFSGFFDTGSTNRM